MLDLFFSNNAGWFALPAFVGTFFFVLRLVLLTVGAVGDADVDADAVGGDFDVGGDVELDMDGADVPHPGDHVDPGDAFRIVSVQTIAAFLMGFGWAGLGAYRGSNLEWPLSLAIAAAGGVGMVWLLMLLLKFIYSLQSSGNVDLRDALGAEGVVYVTIPGDGRRGQARIVIDGRQRIFNVVSEGGEIETKRRVRVVRINRDRTLTVRAL